MPHAIRSLAVALPLVVLAVPGLAQEAADEEAAVRAALEHYLLGHATGDGAHHEMVFHSQAKLFWMRDDSLNTRTSAEYIAGASGSPAADEDQRRREITMVDVTGDAAVAKIVLDYPDALITDYMSLLKVDGQWKIVNKIFTVSPRG
ncbi:MAG: nuclear transport factor 2 family protein [Gemmatimonadota bacterium]